MPSLRKQTTALLLTILLAGAVLTLKFAATPVSAQGGFQSGSTGADGAFSPTVSQAIQLPDNPLVKDVQRHGLKILPVDVTKSDWKCTLEPLVRHQSSVVKQPAISDQPSAISQNVSGRGFSRATQTIDSNAALAAETKAVSHQLSALNRSTPVIVNRFIAVQGFAPTVSQPTWDEIGAYSHSDFVPTAQRPTHTYSSVRESTFKDCHPERSEGPAFSPRFTHMVNLPSDNTNLKSPNSSMPEPTLSETEGCLCGEKKPPALALRLGRRLVEHEALAGAQLALRVGHAVIEDDVVVARVDVLEYLDERSETGDKPGLGQQPLDLVCLLE